MAVATLATADVASLMRESSCAVAEDGPTLRRRKVEKAGRKLEGRIVAFGSFSIWTWFGQSGLLQVKRREVYGLAE